jgi:hypothetical protein
VTVEHLLPTPDGACLPDVWRALDPPRRPANFNTAVRYAHSAANGDLVVGGADMHVVTGRYTRADGSVVLLLSGDCGAVHPPDDQLQRLLWVKLTRSQLDTIAFLARAGSAPISGRSKRDGTQVAVTQRMAAALQERGLVDLGELLTTPAARLTDAGEAAYIAHRTRRDPQP